MIAHGDAPGTVEEVTTAADPTAFLHLPGPHLVPLDLFTAHVAPPECSVYVSLTSMAARLVDDPVEGAIIADLAEQYRAAGRFNEPVRVVDGHLDDGCHRFSALTVLGAQHVQVWVADDDHPDPYWVVPSPVYYVTVRLVDGDFAYEGYFDVAVCAARSFPFEGGWVDGDGVSTCGTELCVSLYCTDDQAPRVGDAVVARLASHGVTTELISVERCELD